MREIELIRALADMAVLYDGGEVAVYGVDEAALYVPDESLPARLILPHNANVSAAALVGGAASWRRSFTIRDTLLIQGVGQGGGAGLHSEAIADYKDNYLQALIRLASSLPHEAAISQLSMSFGIFDFLGAQYQGIESVIEVKDTHG